MPLHIYDTRTQTLREFVPKTSGHVGMYVCGPTVQSSPHIGHLRSALVYDILRRWLTVSGYSVTLVRNVTDIEDKVLDGTSGEEWWARAYRVECEFAAEYRELGILPPTYEPRATGHIPEMIALIEELQRRGHAYPALDDSGDVYFATETWPEYGSFTRQSRESMASAGDAPARGKRDVRDFAVWKGRKPHESPTASWETPWGSGRPGWHIECSAMAVRYLGIEFDIHGGGLDLRFPHHENECAQSSAAGHPFARYWVHNALVQIEGQKMSKSLGNSVFAADLRAFGSPLAVRYALAAAHYRSPLDYAPTSLTEAESAVSRIRSFLRRAGALPPTPAGPVAGDLPLAFGAALDDDLGVPRALGVIHEHVSLGNIACDAEARPAMAEHAAAVAAMVGVLGLDPRDPHWAGGGGNPEAAALDALVSRLVTGRATARNERDFATADRIRDDLAGAGIALEDGPDGTAWSVTR